MFKHTFTCVQEQEVKLENEMQELECKQLAAAQHEIYFQP